MIAKEARNALFGELRRCVQQYPKIHRQYDAVYLAESGPIEATLFEYPMELGLSFDVTDRHIEDAEWFRRSVFGLMAAMNQSNELAAVAPFELDSLFAIERGNVATVPLSADGLKYAERQIVSELEAKPRRLLVPPELEQTAHRLAGSGDGIDYQILDFLDSPSAWFVLTSAPGLMRVPGVPFEAAINLTDDGEGLVVTGYERATWVCCDWRAMWGSFPNDEDDGP